VGRAGRGLDRGLEENGVDLSTAGYLNLIKCRPPNNRFDRIAAAACRPFLDRQLDLLHPEVVVPLGAQALRSLAPGAPTITAASGRPIASERRVTFPLFHPAAPLHNPRLRSRWGHDLTELGRFLGRARRERV
jgi:uracil-DNA glycosylase